jgi:hypothetical protein
MISYEGEVKIVDFGIAKAESRAQEDTQHGIIKGKFYYMSPEQAHGHHIDARTDIFAAGMVLYELLAGRNPYTRVEEFELLKAVRQAKFPAVSSMRPDVDPDLEEIVSRATQRDANYRYETARAMQMDLMAYLDRHHGPYRRMKLAEYVRGVGDRRAGNGVGDDIDSAVMSRDDFTASEASMIFEAGEVLSDDDHRLDSREDEPNPFADEEPTQLWTPDAPPPVDGPDEDSRRSFGAASGSASGSAPASIDNAAGFDGADAVPAPKPSTRETRLPLRERLIPASFGRTHLIFGALAVLVVGLGVVLTYLLMSGGESADTPRHQPVGEPTGAQAAGATAATRATTVDVRITSTPPGAEVHLDDAQQGYTPTILENLSTGKSYDLMLSLPGGRSLERVIQPTRETSELEFDLPEGDAVLKVATYPPNAQISVDGNDAGRSPVDVPGLERSKTHEVVAILDDGREVSRSVSWESDDGRVKQVELQFDATARADDKPSVAKDTPRRAKPAPKRRRRRRSRKKTRSSASSEKTLDLWGNSDSKKASTNEPAGSVKLDVWGAGGEKAAQKGTLSVRIEGKGKVYIDGKLVADATTSYKHSLEAGTYSVRVYFSRLKRYSSTKTIRVRNGKTSSLSFAP